jgi:hypothetical protein
MRRSFREAVEQLTRQLVFAQPKQERYANWLWRRRGRDRGLNEKAGFCPGDISPEIDFATGLYDLMNQAVPTYGEAKPSAKYHPFVFN